MVLAALDDAVFLERLATTARDGTGVDVAIETLCARACKRAGMDGTLVGVAAGEPWGDRLVTTDQHICAADGRAQRLKRRCLNGPGNGSGLRGSCLLLLVLAVWDVVVGACDTRLAEVDRGVLVIAAVQCAVGATTVWTGVYGAPLILLTDPRKDTPVGGAFVH